MKKLLLLGIIISLILPVSGLANRKYEEEALIFNLLEDLGGDYLEEDVSINVSISKSFMKEDEMRALGDEIVKALKVQGEELDLHIEYSHLPEKHYFKEVIFELDYSQINYMGYDMDGNQVTMILSSYLDEESQTGESFLFINIVKNEHLFKINDIIIRIESISQLKNKPLEITTCLMSKQEGRIEDKDVELMVKKALKKFDGKIIEEFNDGYSLSYTAYTPYIDNYITINNKKFNLNFAIRYNNNEDETYIWIGTPILTNGF